MYEVLEGEVRSRGESDVLGARQAFGRVQAIDFDESIALDAARMQDQLTEQGTPMPTYDLLVAASARATGETLLVSDGDFSSDPLSASLEVQTV